jgi:hypothetical protein
MQVACFQKLWNVNDKRKATKNSNVEKKKHKWES